MANIFSRRFNWLTLKLLTIVVVAGGGLTAGAWYYLTPKYARTGYQPAQPIPFSHKIHAGELGLDCRYCHSFVEVGAYSNIPTTQVCMNCHSQIQKDSPKLAPLRESWETGKPVKWVQVHETPDHVYFNHSVHVNRGVGCVSCHGKVNEMEVVHHAEPQSMAWCLDCHRNPENHLRPVSEVTNFAWQAGGEGGSAKSQRDFGLELVQKAHINPPVKNCAGCHR